MMQIEREPRRREFGPAATPHLWIILDSHSRTPHHVLFGDTAEDLVEGLGRAFLRRNRPTPLVADHSPARRAGRKGSQGDAER